jgi:hypothetical protein
MRRDRLHGVYVNLQLYLSLVDQVHHRGSLFYLFINPTDSDHAKFADSRSSWSTASASRKSPLQRSHRWDKPEQENSNMTTFRPP